MFMMVLTIIREHTNVCVYGVFGFVLACSGALSDSMDWNNVYEALIIHLVVATIRRAY